jgi:hypothetical protein
MQRAAPGRARAASEFRPEQKSGAGPPGPGIALPAAIVVPPLAALGGVVLILAALIAVEFARYADDRRRTSAT